MYTILRLRGKREGFDDLFRFCILMNQLTKVSDKEVVPEEKERVKILVDVGTDRDIEKKNHPYIKSIPRLLRGKVIFLSQVFALSQAFFQ